MRVLVACEESQEVCKAFRARGHEAYSCDIQEPSGGHPEWHILGDALKAIEGGQVTTMDGQTHDVGRWDLLIAHPPCTYLSNAGARHLYKGHQLQPDRVMLGIQARDFFMRFWLASVSKIAVENPTPSRVFAMPPYAQAIQPYEYGHPYTKRTCLWLKGLPPLQPTHIVEPTATWCPSGSYSGKHAHSIGVCLPATAPATALRPSRALPPQWQSSGEFDPVDGLWKPNHKGLGYARVLDYIGVAY